MSADRTASDRGKEEPAGQYERVEIFDTTLRDGEQSPGISLNTQEKVEIASQLARLGVDVIEAGFPITSPGDFEAVQAISRTVSGPVICGLARAQKGDIDAAWNAIKDSERPRIHTFISTSDIHIEHQMRNTREDVKAGARQVECAINGIGERAGNCSLEEIAMLIKVREAAHGLTTGINSTEIARTSRMVSRLTGYVVQPNKAIVGKNAFAHESGIHQDGVLKERSTFEIMDATEVGLDSNSIVLGKHSGRHALKDALEEQLGFVIDGAALNQAFKAFKAIADKKKEVSALDLEAIVSDELRDRTQSHELNWFEVEAGSRRQPLARVNIKLPSGEESVAEASGDGPVDSIFGAIQKATGNDAELREFRVGAVTGGDDALGEVTVTLRDEGRNASGQGVSTDILEASARAYVRALSNLLDGMATAEAEAATADAASELTGP